MVPTKPQAVSTPVTSHGIAAQEDPNPHNSSGSVMVLMSTTQAAVFVAAALLVAAAFGALVLWVALAYDPYGTSNP